MSEILKFLLGNAPAIVILLIAALALFILGLVGNLQTPLFSTNLNWLQRLVALAVSIGLFVLGGAAIVPATPGSMPIGTVVMWWGEGTKESLPHGFELCDGDWSQSLKRNRPNLIERFVRGARAEAKSPGNLQTGGQDSFILPDHVHTIPSHSHGLTNAYAAWGQRTSGGADYIQWFQQQKRGKWEGGYGVKPSWNGLGGDVVTEPHADGTAIFGSTDESQPLKTDSTTQPTIDNRPRFQEMFFIIKVAD